MNKEEDIGKSSLIVILNESTGLVFGLKWN